MVSCKTSQKIKSENPNYKPLEYGFEEKSKMTGVYKTRKRAATPSFLIYTIAASKPFLARVRQNCSAFRMSPA